MVTANKKLVFGYNSANRQHCGIGADDKNGIWICLKSLEESAVLKCAFFVAEEVGCAGSHRADMLFFNDCRFVLECDRKGNGDMVTQANMTALCSEEFIRDVAPQDYGYKETQGMLTDVIALKSRGLNLSCTNLSCGYYYPHSEHEFTNVEDLKNCLDFVRHIIRDCRGVYKHKKKRIDWSSYLPEYGMYDNPYLQMKRRLFEGYESQDEEDEEDEDKKI